MNQLMTPAEFAAKSVGLPWKKWRSDWEAVDCYGLLLLYLLHVQGIDLGEVPHTDIIDGFDTVSGWEACEPQTGAIGWMAFRDGAPTHCGILLGRDRVLHAAGDEERGGSVRVSSLRFIRELYGVVTFFRRVEQC